MIKEELFVTINGERKQLDLPSPSGITLKWVSNLFTDLSKLTCSYSYTFKLPITRNNREVLDMCDDVRKGSTLPKKVVNADFCINGINLCPNANLYISEVTDTFSCVLTWRVLKAFQTLKDDDKKINELASLGNITWGGNETYGGKDKSHSNTDAVLYPDHDAGVIHTTSTPPRPCVPIYRIVQLINEQYGVKFNIGRALEGNVGLLHLNHFNNKDYYGAYVYDDYISYGVIPLTEASIDNTKYIVKNLQLESSYNAIYGSHTIEQKWVVVYCAYTGHADTKNLYYIEEGSYMDIQQSTDEAFVNATYVAPVSAYVGIPIFNSFSQNAYIMPICVYRCNTANAAWRNSWKAQVEKVRDIATNGNGTIGKQGEIEIEITEGIYDSVAIGTSQSFLPPGQTITIKSDSLGGTGLLHNGTGTATKIGICGFYANAAVDIYGYATIRISASAMAGINISNGRPVNDPTYMWMCIASTNGNLNELSAATSNDASKDTGCQSYDIPIYDEATNSYTCHFDFGHNYDVRKISLEANSDSVGYVFLPYFLSDDYELGKYKEGDFVFTELVIEKIVPNIDTSTSLPVTLNVTACLPDVSCFNFMKALFYMNGAMPKVGKDGVTISAMYYNQLRDRMNEQQAVDWSGKLLTSVYEDPKSKKFHNTSFAQKNYLEMAYSQLGKTKEELNEEKDKYDLGYGSVDVDDEILDSDNEIFTSPYYPPYLQNLAYPLVKVGNTYKLWEGDNTMMDSISPVYGLSNFRRLNSQYEDATTLRPGMTDISAKHIRMNVFSPFDNTDIMTGLFGYLGAMLDNYTLVKEKLNLTELDLLNFDEAMPVYLSKYNAYFAVSTIQRDKTGVCTVELVKLPKRIASYAEIIKETGLFAIITDGSYLSIYNNYSTSESTFYYKANKNDDWHELTNKQIALGDDSIYMITADIPGDSTNPVVKIDIIMTGKYRYSIYEGSELVSSTEKQSTPALTANEYSIEHNTQGEADVILYEESYRTGGTTRPCDFVTIKVDVPFEDEYNEVKETYTWVSPIFAPSKAYAEAHEFKVRLYCNVTEIIIEQICTAAYVLFCNVDETPNEVTITTDADNEQLVIENVTNTGFSVDIKMIEDGTVDAIDKKYDIYGRIYNTYSINIDAVLNDGTVLDRLSIPAKVYKSQLLLFSSSVTEFSYNTAIPTTSTISADCSKGNFTEMSFVLKELLADFHDVNLGNVVLSNAKFSSTIENGTFKIFQTEVFTQDEETDITVTVPKEKSYSGIDISKTWHLKASYIE